MGREKTVIRIEDRLRIRRFKMGKRTRAEATRALSIVTYFGQLL